MIKRFQTKGLQSMNGINISVKFMKKAEALLML